MYKRQIIKTGSARESIEREVGPFGFSVSSSAPDEQAEVRVKIPSKNTENLNSFLNMFLFILFRQRDFYRRDVIPYDENRVLLLLPK